MLTDKQVKGLRADLTRRQEVYLDRAFEYQKRVDAGEEPIGGDLSLSVYRLKGKASGLAIALDAIEDIEGEDTRRRWV